jgi:hypothetical protein
MDGKSDAGTSTAPMTLAMAKRLGKAGTLGLAGRCLVAHLERAEAIEAAARDELGDSEFESPNLARLLDAEVRPWR